MLMVNERLHLLKYQFLSLILRLGKPNTGLKASISPVTPRRPPYGVSGFHPHPLFFWGCPKSAVVVNRLGRPLFNLRSRAAEVEISGHFPFFTYSHTLYFASPAPAPDPLLCFSQSTRYCFTNRVRITAALDLRQLEWALAGSKVVKLFMVIQPSDFRPVQSRAIGPSGDLKQGLV